MSNLRDIKRRIVSVKKTQQITKAMKMVSASKFRRSQEKIIAARPYGRNIEQVLQSLALRTASDVHPLLQKGETGVIELVVITGDKGLCGGFNNNVIKAATSFMKEHSDRTVNMTLVGKKSKEFFSKRNVSVRGIHSEFFNNLGYEHAVRIAREIINNYTEEEIEKVVIIYNEFKSAMTQTVTTKQLLPIEPVSTGKPEDSVDFIYEPSREKIFEQLLPRYVEVMVYNALLESLASEYAARMAAMENATKNAGEMISSLTLKYNKARQAAITKELLEIVAGAEALKG